MTAVAIPVTGAGAPGREDRAQPRRAAVTLSVVMPTGEEADRQLAVELARALEGVVAQMAPGAEARCLLPLDAAQDDGDPPLSASERAKAAWQADPRTVVLLDADARLLTVGGDPVSLTYKELALLEYLVRASHRAVSREELLRTVWSTAESVEGTRTIDVHVRRLRKKLGGFVQIVTVRGVGYRCDLTPDVVLVGSGDAG